jgi:type II secretory pathway pseudopilin PulG
MKRKMQNAERRTKTRTPHPRSSFCIPRSSFCVSSAFTMTEIMIVIVIIVLMLSMAMPVFRLMSGSRSEESASNQIAAFLGSARSQAIGLQQSIGVAFFPDSSGRCQMAIVQREIDAGFVEVGRSTITPTFYPKWTYLHRVVGTNPVISTYFVALQDVPAGTRINNNLTFFTECDPNVIDKITDSDAEALPQGVGVKLVNDWGAASGGTTQASDGYVSIGVIMFDKNGQLTTQQFSISASGFLGSTMQMSQLPGNPDNYPVWQGNGTSYLTNSAGSVEYAMAPGVYSQFGLVLYDRDAYQNQGYTNSDPTYTSTSNTNYSTGTPSEKQADQWLDQNAAPLLINRFNGTLVKGE